MSPNMCAKCHRHVSHCICGGRIYTKQQVMDIAGKFCQVFIDNADLIASDNNLSALVKQMEENMLTLNNMMKFIEAAKHRR